MKNKTKIRHKHTSEGNAVVWVVVAVLILAVIGMGYMYTTQPTYDEAAMTQSPAPGDEAPNDVEYVDEEISENPDEGVTAADILSNPDGYEELTVQLRAEVEEWIGPRAFALDAQGVVGDNLLVITDDPQLIFEDPEIFGDAIWEVNGEVQRFQVTVLEDLDLDLEPELVSVYEGRPYIMADSVELFEE